MPIDAVIARRPLHIRSDDGSAVDGLSTLAEDARTWAFTPRDPWPTAPHHFIADPWLEDLAGNTVERIFDDDLAATGATGLPLTKRSFTPR